MEKINLHKAARAELKNQNRVVFGLRGCRARVNLL